MGWVTLPVVLLCLSPRADAMPEDPDDRAAVFAGTADWRGRHADALAEAWRSDPIGAARVRELTPGVTRAGGPRFILPDRGPGTTAVLLARFLDAGDPPAVRAALLDALARTEGDWAPGIAAAYADEESANVREVMVEVMRRQEPALAQPVLRAGAKDSSPLVRSAAVRGMGWTEDAGWSPALVQALSDADAGVRADAARALGWVGAMDAWAPLVDGIRDADPTVRLKAMRALQRLDPARAASEAVVQACVTDPDARVARAAGQIVGRR